ncbi:hypothetical protein F5146DRAFT_1022100 [Armillaria mellea]|nr:hypothetical protein F5146DRAFT_1022100 [Armillaria mellea]
MTLRAQNQTDFGGDGSSTGDGSSNNNDQTDSSSSSNAGAIAGGVVGGLATLTLLVLGVLMYQRRQRRKHEGTSNQRSAWPSSTSGAPLLTPQPYDLYGSHGSRNPPPSLRPGQQCTSVEPYPQYKGGVPIILSTTSGPIAIAPTPSHRLSSSVNQNGRSNSDNSTSVQLRSEMENLRREVEELRARSLYEPPPQYT